jgi:glycerophosphoryl diester phosphodiesterase
MVHRDFTLAELKTLRAEERIALGPANAALAASANPDAPGSDRPRGATASASTRNKHPTYFDGIGLSLEEPLVATLNRNGYTKRSSRCSCSPSV